MMESSPLQLEAGLRISTGIAQLPFREAGVSGNGYSGLSFDQFCLNSQAAHLPTIIFEKFSKLSKMLIKN